MSSFQLAELNSARLRAPLDAPMIKDFADGLARINAVAKASPGFIWRLKDDSGNATAFKPYDDPLMDTHNLIKCFFKV